MRSHGNRITSISEYTVLYKCVYMFVVMIDSDGRKQPKREHVDEAGQQLHPGYSAAHRASKTSVVAGHRLSYHQGSADTISRPTGTDYTSSSAVTCRQFVDAGADSTVVKQQRTSSDTCRQQMTSLADIADEISSCAPLPAPPGVVAVSPQCQYFGHGSFQPPLPSSYSDQLYYAARGPGSAMATGSGTAGLYNPYDPVVAAGLHRLQQAGHMMGSPCTLSGGYNGSGGGYYAGLMAAGSARTAGGSPYVGSGSASQYHCSGVPYAGSTHHQMSSLMNLAGSAAAACITPPSPQPPARMQTFVSNNSL